MSYKHGPKSTAQRKTLYPWLRLILFKMLLRHDHSVDQGGRTDEEQWAFFRAKTSTLHPPDGKHLFRKDPSSEFEGLWAFAADVTPFIKGTRLATHGTQFTSDRRAQFAFFLGIFQEVAEDVLAGTGWEIRLGVNWDRDDEILSDQDFDDWFHVELIWAGR